MTKQWGGRRPGSGAPRRRLLLDKDTGHSLAVLTKQWRTARNNPALTEEDVVAELIREALKQTQP